MEKEGKEEKKERRPYEKPALTSEELFEAVLGCGFGDELSCPGEVEFS